MQLKNNKIAICGSYAFDSIMNFHDKFKNHILPDKTHMLNVAFLVPTMRREFGGCAGNIAYNANLLGLDITPVATVGSDFTPYMEWLKKCNIDTSFIKIIENQYTGQAFITTDEDDNQITAFHPGAMGEAHTQDVMDTGCGLGIVSPDGKFGMIKHAKDFADNNIPFIFDPGQGLPMFDKGELLTFIDQATWICVNDYEAEMLSRTTSLTISEIASKVEAMIITKGSKGCEIITAKKTISIAGEKAELVADPTGCGDSFRAGVLYGIIHNWDWEQTAQLANSIGAIKVAHQGTQNHTLDSIKI
jgi:adenosine kinase